MTDTVKPTQKLESMRITSVVPLSRLSYWQYSRLKRCQLSGLFPLNTTQTPGISQFITYSRPQVLGLAFHRILETIDKETKQSGPPSVEAVRSICNKVIELLENELINKTGDTRYQGISEWAETGHVLSTVDSIQRSKSTTTKSSNQVSNTRFISERLLISKNGRIVGKPDLIIQRGHWISLLDYKLSTLDTIQTEILQTYIDQLLLYAQLTEETFKCYPKEAWIIGKGGEKLQAPLNRKASLQLRHDMEAFLDHTNRQIAQAGEAIEKLANPSDSACAFCDAKPWCPSLRKNAQHLNLPKSKQFVFGVQASPAITTRRAGTEINIKPIYTSMDHTADIVTLTRVHKQWFPTLKDQPGQLIFAINLAGSKTNSAAMANFETQIVAIDKE